MSAMCNICKSFRVPWGRDRQGVDGRAPQGVPPGTLEHMLIGLVLCGAIVAGFALWMNRRDDKRS